MRAAAFLVALGLACGLPGVAAGGKKPTAEGPAPEARAVPEYYEREDVWRPEALARRRFRPSNMPVGLGKLA